MNQILKKHWFLLSLIVSLVLGFVFASDLEPLVQQVWIRYAVIFAVMFLMAWSLETTQIVKSIRRPKAPLLASFINLGLMPLMAWPFSLLFFEDWSAGIIATSATPCTLAAASVWTRRAGGNDVTAIMTTVMTNSVCFLVTPIWIGILAAKQSDGVPVLEMIVKLFLLVVLPMVLAQVTRIHKPLARWATSSKFKLGSIAQLGILIMVLLGAIQMASKMDQAWDLSFVSMLALLSILLSVLHFGSLFLGIFLAKKIGCEPEDQIAVGISGSQKTLMVGLTTSMEMGISVLPIVVYHTIQLVGDTPVADWFRRRHFSEDVSRKATPHSRT